MPEDQNVQKLLDRQTSLSAETARLITEQVLSIHEFTSLVKEVAAAAKEDRRALKGLLNELSRLATDHENACKDCRDKRNGAIPLEGWKIVATIVASLIAAAAAIFVATLKVLPDIIK